MSVKVYLNVYHVSKNGGAKIPVRMHRTTIFCIRMTSTQFHASPLPTGEEFADDVAVNNGDGEIMLAEKEANEVGALSAEACPSQQAEVPGTSERWGVEQLSANLVLLASGRSITLGSDLLLEN